MLAAVSLRRHRPAPRPRSNNRASACAASVRVTRRQNRCHANGAMDFFSTGSGGVISSVATVKTDITATAAAIVDDIAEEIVIF